MVGLAYMKKLLQGGYVGTKAVLTADSVLSVAASALALCLMTRFVGIPLQWDALAGYTAIALMASWLLLLATRSHRSVIRHMKLRGVTRLFVATLGKEAALTPFCAYALGYHSKVVAALALVDMFTTMFTLMGVRVVLQVAYDYLQAHSKERHKSERVLIYGMRDKSASLITRLQNSPHYRVVGFLFYSEDRKQFTIADLPVSTFASVDDMAAIISKANVDAVLFAHRSDARAEEGRLIKYCRQHNIRTLYAPTIDGLNNAAQEHSLREINIEDLLDRPSIQLSMGDIIANFRGKTVMVTGAAGSIGSELCRQLATFGVNKIVMLDAAETPMHVLRLEFEESFPELQIAPVIGDVRNVQRLDDVMRTHKPQVVFHAAAYKHVPLMEENPTEAILTNVVGSYNVANVCLEHDVQMMVMISTDKAVNPTNVMGCSKRLAEIYVQSLGLAVERGEKPGKTRFVTTRFGNVLGSNGSVIPRFKEQIAKGGPVTVTHPEINRFFMTIPEACKLVMEAATISIGNQIFVFDMGKSVKIVHLAERMIRLAGYEPNVDIKIEFTGLRPGEKLYEEVLSDEERTMPTGHSQIRIAKVREYDYDDAVKAVDDLRKLALEGDVTAVVKRMKTLVPEFLSKNSPYEQLDEKGGR